MKLDTLMVLLDATQGSLTIKADRLGLFKFTAEQRTLAVNEVFAELSRHKVEITMDTLP